MATRHHESHRFVAVVPAEVFSFIDDHSRFSSHMSESSWMMGGGSMSVELDEAKGQAVGSHIRLSGRVLGMRLYLDEVVTERNPPFQKTWETVAEPRLLVIGRYRMGFAVTPANNGSELRVFIDYAWPPGGLPRWLGRMFGGWYARWCTRSMVGDAVRYYASRGREGASTTGTAM